MELQVEALPGLNQPLVTCNFFNNSVYVLFRSRRRLWHHRRGGPVDGAHPELWRGRGASHHAGHAPSTVGAARAPLAPTTPEQLEG